MRYVAAWAGAVCINQAEAQIRTPRARRDALRDPCAGAMTPLLHDERLRLVCTDE
jgi:hypothetical protein